VNNIWEIFNMKGTTLKTVFFILTACIALFGCAGEQKVHQGQEAASGKEEITDKDSLDESISEEDRQLLEEAQEKGFLDAACKGDTKAMKIFLVRGIRLDARSKRGLNGLHLAVLNGRSESIKFLANKGLDINSPDRDGYTPLDYAVDSRASSEIQTLLRSKGGALKHPNRTVIMNAALKGKIETLKELISEGDSIQVSDTRGSTPLHLAVLNGHESMVKFLIANKASIDARDRSFWAIINTTGGIPVLHVDENWFELPPAKTSGATPLHWAIYKGHKVIAELLVRKSANINQLACGFCTPLHLAAWGDHKSIALLLVSKGANVNQMNNESPNGATPLDWAKTDEMKKLLRENKGKKEIELKTERDKK